MAFNFNQDEREFLKYATVYVIFWIVIIASVAIAIYVSVKN